ncbi:MAG: hypothetical protein J6K39_03470 [Clostridia bacterium]|nr:hypothetical protein [Clostridia bacterium]
MAKNFKDIFEEMTWEMFKLSGGNPYIVQDMVRERNAERQKQTEKTL